MSEIITDKLKTDKKELLNLLSDMRKETDKITLKYYSDMNNSKLYKFRDELMQRGADALSRLNEDNRPLLYTHNDGDGLTAALIMAIFLENKNTRYDLVIMDETHRGNYASKIIPEVRRNHNDYVICTDVSVDKETERGLKEKEVRLIELDHHAHDLEDKIQSTFTNPDFHTYVNSKLSLEDAASASPLAYKVCERTGSIERIKDRLMWLAVLGAASDKQLLESLEFLDLPSSKANAYARGNLLDPFLDPTKYALAMSYSNPQISQTIFNHLKEAYYTRNPLYFWLTKKTSSKEVFELIDEAEEQTRYWLSQQKGRIINDDAGIYIQKVYPEEYGKRNESQADIKRMILSALGIIYPEYSVASMIQKGDIYKISIRRNEGTLKPLLDELKKYRDENNIPTKVFDFGGHGGSAGGIMDVKYEKLFIDYMSQYANRDVANNGK